MTDSASDRLRIDYTSGVPIDVRLAIVDDIVKQATACGLFVTQHYDKTISGWAIDITVHDPNAPHPVTDTQVLDLLQSVMRELGLTVDDIRRAAREASQSDLM